MEYYVHHVPGRLRIKTPVIHNSEDNARTLCAYAETVLHLAAMQLTSQLRILQGVEQ